MHNNKINNLLRGEAHFEVEKKIWRLNEIIRNLNSHIPLDPVKFRDKDFFVRITGNFLRNENFN